MWTWKPAQDGSRRKLFSLYGCGVSLAAGAPADGRFSHRRDRTGWLPWRDSNRSASISNRSAGVICKLTSHANISETVRTIFRRYLDLGSMGAVIEDLDQRGIRTNV